VDKIRAVYKHRCELMIKTMQEEFPPEAKFTDPDGGLFTWVELPSYVNTRDLAAKAMENNVAFVPGSGFFPNGGNNSCMRLNYSCMPDERIVEGVKRLAAVIKSAIK
jgi:2-aminoadipate transaminase